MFRKPLWRTLYNYKKCNIFTYHRNIFYLCNVVENDVTYFFWWKCNRFYPCSEIWKISKCVRMAFHSSPCIGVFAIEVFYLLHACTGVEYCLFTHRYSRTSEQMDDLAPHFSLYITIKSLGAVTQTCVMSTFFSLFALLLISNSLIFINPLLFDFIIKIKLCNEDNSL